MLPATMSPTRSATSPTRLNRKTNKYEATIAFTGTAWPAATTRLTAMDTLTDTAEIPESSRLIPRSRRPWDSHRRSERPRFAARRSASRSAGSAPGVARNSSSIKRRRRATVLAALGYRNGPGTIGPLDLAWTIAATSRPFGPRRCRRQRRLRGDVQPGQTLP